MPLRAGLAKLKFFLLLISCSGVFVGRGIEYFLAFGMHPRAGGLAMTLGDLLDITRFQIHDKDLKERVLGVALTLKDELGSISIVVAFARTFAGKGDLADIAEECPFRFLGRLCPRGGSEAGGETEQGETEQGETGFHEHEFMGDLWPGNAAVQECALMAVIFLALASSASDKEVPPLRARSLLNNNS